MEAVLLEQLHFLQDLIDSIPTPIFYKNTEGRYTGCNKEFEKFLGRPRQEIIGKTVYDLAPRELADKYYAKDQELFDNPGVQVYEYSVEDNDGQRHDVIFNKATFEKTDGSLGGLIGVIFDITERNKLAMEREKLIGELKEAFDQIKTLKGIIPICMICKNIRDDQGYWNRLEKFISEHSEAQFSHGICPKCMKEKYPEYSDDDP